MRKYRNIKANLQPKRILKYSEEYIEYRKKRGGNSVKVEHCDTNIDGFDDSIVRGWRSPAAGKTQTCTEIPPAAGPGNLEFLLPPASGPVNLEIAIEAASIGPSLLNADVVKPVVGPTQLSAEEIAAASDLIVAVSHNTTSSAQIDVYREDTESGTLVENGDLGTRKGRVISYSADGRIVIVSAWRDNIATVYEWNETEWVQRGSAITFSGSVTLMNAGISPDGNTIAYTDFRYENDTGRVFVATWDSSSADYVQKAIIVGEWEDQELGHSPSRHMFIANDGERIAWYNEGKDEANKTLQQFLIYDWSGTGYELKTTVEGDIGFTPPFAGLTYTGLHMSQDMQTAAIIYGTTVYVLDWNTGSQKWLVRHNKGWSKVGEPAYSSVAMSDDGNTLFISSLFYDTYRGSLWIVEWSGTDWVIKKQFLASELIGANESYWWGFSSYCTANGNAVVVCGVQRDCPAIIIRKTTSGTYQVENQIAATPGVQFGYQCSIAGSPDPVAAASALTQGPTSLTSTTLPPDYGIVNITADILEQYYVRFVVRHLTSFTANHGGGFRELDGSNMLPKLTLTNFPDPLFSVEQTEDPTELGYDIYALPVGGDIDYIVSNSGSPHYHMYETVNDYPWTAFDHNCTLTGPLRAFNNAWPDDHGWIVNFQENGAYGYDPEWDDGYKTAIFNLRDVDGVKTSATGNGIYRYDDVITGTWRDLTYSSQINHRYKYTGCDGTQKNLS